MTLQEIIEALDELSPEERHQLRAELDRRIAYSISKRGETPEQRIQQIRAAAQSIREGFSDEEWEEVVHAMNDEYIEPIDESEWKD